jgi:diguanylate cyclase (GGDEF)-like protein
MWLNKKLQANSGEATSNQYVIHCMNVTILILIGIWLLNILDIFLVSKKVMTYSILLSLIVYLIGMICWISIGINKRCMKYFIILWTVMLTTIMCTGLTYHAMLASVLPILFCSLYSSRRLMIFTCLLMIFSTIIVVFVGYHFGICDANMTLLTGEPLSIYLDENGLFTRTDVNNQLLWSLSLFFVFPRCLIYMICMVVSYNISKIIRHNIEHAKHMEVLAEIDGMTGLYNRSKYLSMCSNEYTKSENLSIVFWDINNLKVVNDTQGHEAGDLLIRTVANAIHNLIQDNYKAFRIGGDEFIMILNNADEKEACKVADAWKANIDSIKSDYPFEISAAIGYASGTGKDLKEILNTADKMMYEEKKKYHEQNGDRRLN